MPGGHPRSVLIIEDEMLTALDLKQFVEGMGLSVCGMADTEAKAVEQARICRPALILSDIRLREGEDGIRAVQEIVRCQQVPVVFVTANPSAVPARGMGHLPVIGKPYSYNELTRVIRTALGNSASAGR